MNQLGKKLWKWILPGLAAISLALGLTGLHAAAETKEITSSDTTIDISTLEDGETVRITENGDYTITGSRTYEGSSENPKTIGHLITVAADVNAQITLQNVSLQFSQYALGGGISIESGAKVTLTLNGSNEIGAYGPSFYAAINVPEGAELTIQGEGALYASTIGYSAAIGGLDGASAGTITIESGTIEAETGTLTLTLESGAAIGGGRKGAGGTITIKGGTIEAEAVAAADIGGGYGGEAGNITIEGGSVTTTIQEGIAYPGIGGGFSETEEEVKNQFTISVKEGEAAQLNFGGGNIEEELLLAGPASQEITSAGQVVRIGYYENGEFSEELKVTGGEYQYILSKVFLTGEGPYTIEMQEGTETTNHVICVEKPCTVTLKDVKIDMAENPLSLDSALEVRCAEGETVTLELKGENYIKDSTETGSGYVIDKGDANIQIQGEMNSSLESIGNLNMTVTLSEKQALARYQGSNLHEVVKVSDTFVSWGSDSSWKIAFKELFSLKVESDAQDNGTGSYIAGEKAEISAAMRNSQGDIFEQWTITSGTGTFQDEAVSETTFTMGEGDATVTPTYRESDGYGMYVVDSDSLQNVRYDRDVRTLLLGAGNHKLSLLEGYELTPQMLNITSAEAQVTLNSMRIQPTNAEEIPISAVSGTKLIIAKDAEITLYHNDYGTGLLISPVTLSTEGEGYGIVAELDGEVTYYAEETADFTASGIGLVLTSKPFYTMTVNSGSSVKRPAGTTVSLNAANYVPEGKVFLRWELASGEGTIEKTSLEKTTFTFGAGNAEINCVYGDKPAPPTGEMLKIDYVKETLGAAAGYEGRLEYKWQFYHDWTTLTSEEIEIPEDGMGSSLFLRIAETDSSQESDYAQIWIPDRSRAPRGVYAQVTTNGFQVLPQDDALEYSVDGTTWQTSNRFEGEEYVTRINAGENIPVYVRYKATDSAFSSKVCTIYAHSEILFYGASLQGSQEFYISSCEVYRQYTKVNIASYPTSVYKGDVVWVYVKGYDKTTPYALVNGERLDTMYVDWQNKYVLEYTIPEDFKASELRIEISSDGRKPVSTSVTIRKPEYAEKKYTMPPFDEYHSSPEMLEYWLKNNGPYPVEVTYDNGTKGTCEGSFVSWDKDKWVASGKVSYPVTLSYADASGTYTTVGEAIIANTLITGVEEQSISLPVKTGGYTKEEIEAILPENTKVRGTLWVNNQNVDNYETEAALSGAWTWETEWSEGLGEAASTLTLRRKVEAQDWMSQDAKASLEKLDCQVTITFVNKTKLTDEQITLTVSGWTYGEAEVLPETEVSGLAGESFDYTYYYSSDEGMTWKNELPKSHGNQPLAGTYLVKAVCESTNYYGEKTGSLTISPRALGLKTDTVPTKEYDGTTDAKLTDIGLSNVVSGDMVFVEGASAAYQSKDAGSRTVNVSNIRLGGNDRSNYMLEKETYSLTGQITPKEVTVEGLMAVDRTYDGSKAVELSGGRLIGILDGEEISFTMPRTGMMDNADAGADKAVNVLWPLIGGNYTFKAPQSPTVNIAKATPRVELLVTIDNGTITFTASVDDVSEGTVIFTVDNEPQPAVSMVNGKAEYQCQQSAGEHTVKASYVPSVEQAKNYESADSKPLSYTLLAEEEQALKVEMTTGISEVPEALKNIETLDTAEEIEAFMKLSVEEKVSKAEDSAVYDVTLLYSSDGGQTWTKADENHWPVSGKLTVILPYPDGTGKDTHRFYAAHMFTSTAFGRTPGTMEYPAVTNTEKGILMEITGFSPISLAWEKVTATDTSQSGSGNSSAGNSSSAETTTKKETAKLVEIVTPAYVAVSVPTGDGNAIGLYLVLLGAALAGLLAVKKRHRLMRITD